jgi:hypothetical protein
MDDTKTMISFCGIDCAGCQAYKATRANDPEELRRVAEGWSSEALPLGPDDVRCEGCQSELVFKWAPNCTTRQCGLARGVENCAQCDDYLCEKLEKPWGMLGEETRASCKATLDELAQRYRA